MVTFLPSDFCPVDSSLPGPQNKVLLKDTIRTLLHTNFSTNYHHYHSVSNIFVPWFLRLCWLCLVSVLIFSEPNTLPQHFPTGREAFATRETKSFQHC